MGVGTEELSRMKRRLTEQKKLMRRSATALKRLFERNAVGEVLLEMPHWEFNLDSPLVGDRHHYGVIDFRLERMKLTDKEMSKLTLGFFTTGIVGYSKKGKGWLFFSSGAKGQPELAAASPSQAKTLPRLPADWEDVIVEVD
jgi:hypothetical protein